MRRKERELILRQGVVLPDTPRERREREALAEDIRSTNLYGRPLNLRLRNFRPTADGYLAALGGPLPYMVRLREIALLTADHEQRLAVAWRSFAATEPDDEEFAAAWLNEVNAWSFDEINDLIERHNRFYPVESRLPMDPRTRTYALVGGKDYRRRPLDAAWALERFEPSVESARAADPGSGSAQTGSPRPNAPHDQPKRRRAERRAEEVRRGIPEEIGEPTADRRPGEGADRPGGVHDPERQPLSQSGELRPVGDERDPRRIEAAE